MKKPAVFLAGVGACALAVASCSSATSPTPAPQSAAPADSAQSAPGAPASPTVAPDTALTSKNEAVAASFPGASVSVEREYRNALRGYALRVPAGSLETIRAVSGVQAVYPDGNNSLQ